MGANVTAAIEVYDREWEVVALVPFFPRTAFDLQLREVSKKLAKDDPERIVDGGGFPQHAGWPRMHAFEPRTDLRRFFAEECSEVDPGWSYGSFKEIAGDRRLPDLFAAVDAFADALREKTSPRWVRIVWAFDQ